jgi:hypothetical protein
MIFFVAMPILLGFGTYLIPLQNGSHVRACLGNPKPDNILRAGVRSGALIASADAPGSCGNSSDGNLCSSVRGGTVTFSSL